MAFSKSGLSISRGVYNTSGNPNGIAQHYYKSTDLLSEISAPGYFPNNFSASPDEIKIDDILILQGNGNDRAYKVTSLIPAVIVETIISDNPFDQSLNTTDNATFNQVNTPQLTSDHVITDLISEKTPANGVVVNSVLRADNIDSTVSTNPITITEKNTFLNDGNVITIQLGDGVNPPATQDVLLHLQGKKNADLWQEGDSDTVGGVTTPIHIFTSDGNSNMLRLCLDDTGDAIIDLGDTGSALKMKFRTGGNFLTPTAPGVIPDYNGMGKVAPVDAVVLHADQSVELSKFIGGGTTPANIDNAGKIVRGSIVKSVYFPVVVDTVLAPYRVDVVTNASTTHFPFAIPDDFVSLVSIGAIGWPTAGAAGAGKNIDLSSQYGGVNEAIAIHSETDNTSTYNLGTTDVKFFISFNTVFTSLSAGDTAGVTLTNNSGGDIYLHQLKLIYNASS